MKKRVLIDLDGVLNKYNGNFDKNYIPLIKEGAKEFLESLACEYELKLFTSREYGLAQKWVTDNGLTQYFSGVTNVKEAAYALIDDRCIRFSGNYHEAIKEVKSLNVWWKE